MTDKKDVHPSRSSMTFALLCSLLLLFCLGLTSRSTAAETDAATELSTTLPNELAVWLPWVQQRHPSSVCPWYPEHQSRLCTWPVRTDIEVQPNKGRFRTEVLLYSPGWIALPGDIRHWPQQIQIEPLPLTGHYATIAHQTKEPIQALIRDLQGQPQLQLPAGRWQISGHWLWSAVPAELWLPAQHGVLSLQQDGQQKTPIVHQQRLQLAAQQNHNNAVDTLHIEVQQLLTDQIPGQLTTFIRLDVGGRPRSLILPAVLPAGFSATELNSDLPAWLNQDGSLELQLTAGSAEVRLQSQTLSSVQSIQIPARSAPWPEAEIWAFAAQPHLRTVQLSGGRPVDPSQTSVPADWQQYPLFLLQPGQQFTLTEQQRAGTSQPVQLQLQKKLWLNFAGEQFTIQDQISGHSGQHNRLEASLGYQPGRIDIDGTAQLITQLDKQHYGVEIRQSALQLQAMTPWPLSWHGLSVTLPVTGWQQDFQQVSWQLVLPPGWGLLTATAVDEIQGSWLQKWDLWDIFFVMLVAASCVKLTHWRLGLFAFIGLVLSYHRPDAPQWLWGTVLILMALQQIASGKWALWLQKLQLCNALLLLLVLGNFGVDQIRQAIYPQLDQPWRQIQAPAPISPAPVETAVGSMAPMATQHDSIAVEAAAKAEEIAQASAKRQQQAMPTANEPSANRMPALSTDLADPSANIQTGPAQPAWSWQVAELQWQSTVRADSQTTLYLVPAWLNRLGNLITVAMLFGLAWFLLQPLFRQSWRQLQTPALLNKTNTAASTLKTILSALLIPTLAWSLLATPTPSYSSEFPPEALLNELEQRLLAKPACLPQCSSIEQLQIHMDENQAEIRLLLHSQVAHSWPLPVPVTLLSQLTLAEQPAALLQVNEQAMVLLPRGRIWLQLTVNLTEQQQLSLQLPTPWHQITQQLTGWQADVRAESSDGSQLLEQRRSLSFSRQVATNRADANQTKGTVAMAERLVLWRTLELGLQWRVHHRLERYGKLDKSISVAVPLWPGEQPLSALPMTPAGLQLQLNAGQSVLEWQSALAKNSTFTLKSPVQQVYVEVWQIAHSAKYHLQSQGIPAIEHEGGHFPPRFQPWPGEQLTLQLSEPAAVSAEHLTIRDLSLVQQQQQGVASNELTLTIDTAQAQPFRLQLPAQSTLLQLQLDGQNLPLQSAQQDGAVQLALKAGVQQIQLRFEQNNQTAFWRETPKLTLPTTSANLFLQLQLPADRWLLAVGGPAIGPAILFWGMLLLLLAFAMVLPRVIKSPLSKRHWCLLFAGLSTLSLWLPLLLSIWLAALSWRGRQSDVGPIRFARLRQLLLILLSIVTVTGLLLAIPYALLSSPQMHLTGNGSSAGQLYWYQDQSPAELVQAWAISLPLWCYQLAMLIWSLWLAAALMQWLPWAWRQLSHQGFWPSQAQANQTDTPETPDKQQHQRDL